MNPAELASLFLQRKPFTIRKSNWALDCGAPSGPADPRPFSDLVVHGETSALPFAAGALRRQLEDFPSTADGLARTERQVLTAIDPYRVESGEYVLWTPGRRTGRY